MVGKQLIIFMEDGKTLRFVCVTQFATDDKGFISFYYKGLSTRVASEGIFNTNKIMGYSLSTEEYRFTEQGHIVKGRQL